LWQARFLDSKVNVSGRLGVQCSIAYEDVRGVQLPRKSHPSSSVNLDGLEILYDEATLILASCPVSVFGAVSQDGRLHDVYEWHSIVAALALDQARHAGKVGSPPSRERNSRFGVRVDGRILGVDQEARKDFPIDLR
jgi:hypothetical protein